MPNATTTVPLIERGGRVTAPSAWHCGGSTIWLICLAPPVIQLCKASSDPAAIDPTARVVTKEGTKALAMKIPLTVPTRAPQPNPIAMAAQRLAPLDQAKLVTRTPTATATRSATAGNERSNSPRIRASVAPVANRIRDGLLLRMLIAFRVVKNVSGSSNEKQMTT